MFAATGPILGLADGADDRGTSPNQNHHMIELGLRTRREELAHLRRVAEDALEQFEIQPAGISLLSHYCNTTFAVMSRDGFRYALHIYRTFDATLSADRHHDWIESELWWLDRVRNSLSISAPAPMCTPEGERVIGVLLRGKSETKVPVVLFGWVKGRFLRRRFLPAHLRQVGILTAKLHLKASQFATPEGFCRGQVDLVDSRTEERLACDFAVHSSQAEELARKALARVRTAQQMIGSDPDAFGFIHADIHQGNYLFDHGELALIDFGDCGWGHYLYDLAVTINEIRDLPNGPALRQALLAGYQEVRELPRAHEALIDTFLLLRNVQDLPSFLDQSAPSHAHKTGADRRLARLQRELEMA